MFISRAKGLTITWSIKIQTNIFCLKCMCIWTVTTCATYEPLEEHWDLHVYLTNLKTVEICKSANYVHEQIINLCKCKYAIPSYNKNIHILHKLCATI
jgi:hypothetical protein